MHDPLRSDAFRQWSRWATGSGRVYTRRMESDGVTVSPPEAPPGEPDLKP